MAPEDIQMIDTTGLSLGSQAHATPLDDLESVVALYQPRVFRFLLATLRDRDAAETLTQETFLRAWSARSNFREDCSLATWLIRIALNLARDHTRTGRFRFWKHISASAVDVAEVAASIPNREETAEERLIAQQQVASVWESVAALSARQRSIFLLRFLEEMEIPEIASMTGLPLGTVKSHLYRALAIVRAQHNLTSHSVAPRNSALTHRPMEGDAMTPELVPQPLATQPGPTLCAPLGNTHLTGEQFGELLSRHPEDAGPELALAEAHLQGCEACAAELASLRETIALFRDASSTYADNELRRIPRWEIPNRRVLSGTIVPAYWVAAAAMLLTALLPLQVLRRHASQPARAAAPNVTASAATSVADSTPQSDELLLDDVNRDISASVPASMQALADPTGDAASASSETSNPAVNHGKD